MGPFLERARRADASEHDGLPQMCELLAEHKGTGLEQRKLQCPFLEKPASDASPACELVVYTLDCGGRS